MMEGPELPLPIRVPDVEDGLAVLCVVDFVDLPASVLVTTLGVIVKELDPLTLEDQDVVEMEHGLAPLA